MCSFDDVNYHIILSSEIRRKKLGPLKSLFCLRGPLKGHRKRAFFSGRCLDLLRGKSSRPIVAHDHYYRAGSSIDLPCLQCIFFQVEIVVGLTYFQAIANDITWRTFNITLQSHCFYYDRKLNQIVKQR